MDPETEFDGIRNVGIKDGKIAVITEAQISGKETIDATGLVVAPGFIDTQFHALDEFGIKHGALAAGRSGEKPPAGHEGRQDLLKRTLA